MPAPNTSGRAARRTVWTPPPQSRRISNARHLVGFGISLLVGSVILALIALVLPSSTPNTAASATQTPSHSAVAATSTPKATVTASRGTSTPRPTKRVAPVLSRTLHDTATTRVTKIHWGDTLWSLARRYGTTVAVLQTLNGLGTSTLIYAGHELRLPHSADTGTKALAPASNTSVPAATGIVMSRDVAAAVAYAKAQLGKPYEWGGSGPSAFDCSGLVMRAWQAAGVDLPRTTYAQVRAGRRITRADLLPGDLVFSDGDGHVQLYIGHGQVIEAPYAGARVRISPLPAAALVDAYVRVAQPTTTYATGSTR